MKPFKDRFNIPQNLIVSSFNRAAATYDQYNFLQKYVGEKLIEHLSPIQLKPKSILEIGCGTGFCTALLQQKYPEVHIVSVDISEKMLQCAQEKNSLSSNNSISYLCADAELLPFDTSSFDLIFSNLTLQWLSHYNALFKELEKLIHQNGCFIFSTFGPKTMYEIRESWEGIDAYSHTLQFKDILTLGNTLLETKWKDPVLDHEEIIVYYDDIYKLFKDVKMVGAHNMTQGRSQGLMGKQKWKKFLENYKNFYQHEGQYHLTYQVIYAHAFASEMKNIHFSEKIQNINIPIHHA